MENQKGTATVGPSHWLESEFNGVFHWGGTSFHNKRHNAVMH